MDVKSLLTLQVKIAHEWFIATVGDVTPEMAHYLPPGLAPPIGSRWVHLVVDEDILMNSFYEQRVPMFEGAWAGKTGASDPQGFADLRWAQSVKVDVAALMDYTHAVFDGTETRLAKLSDRDLENTVDMSKIGLGAFPFPIWLSTFVINHAHDVSGEISIVKGELGYKGYPA